MFCILYSLHYFEKDLPDLPDIQTDSLGLTQSTAELDDQTKQFVQVKDKCSLRVI